MMHSILIEHTSEFYESKLSQRMDETMIDCLKATSTINTSIRTQLATLLKINDLPLEMVMTLTRPWYRANMLTTWFTKHDLPTAKERAKDIINTIKQLKKLLAAKSTETGLILMLFLTSTEPDLDRFLFNLNEIQSLFESFTNIDFKNSNELSVNYLKRYAINSLIWMGKQIGLVETGKPTQLNQYIHIVTDQVYAEINKDTMKFKKIDFLSTQKMNQAHLFIYNPHCEITNSILSKIKSRFTTA